MMFRSLLFVAPLVSADEQTAMLQLNRRGEVAQHTVNDALIGSLEQSLLSKDAEKPREDAKCRYYLKTVNADILLQKMSQLKGEDKTQQLLQRAMDSVGEQNLRSLEENLMNKDDDKDKTEVKDSEKKMSPCEVLTELRHAFKHHMDHYWEVEAMTRHTADKVGLLVEESVKKSLKAALAILEADKDALAKATGELKQIKLQPLITEIEEHQKEEVKKSWEAIKNVVPKLKGSTMAQTLNATQTKMEAAVKKYEGNAIGKIESGVAELFTQKKLTAPMKTDKDGNSVPAAGFTDAEVTKIFTAIVGHMSPLDKGKAEEELNKGIEILKKYIDYHFAEEAKSLWDEFALIWTDSSVLATPDEPKKKFLATPPKNIGDDLFWEIASGYLDGNAHVEPVCKSGKFDAKKPTDFVPRNVCDHSDLKCEDEMLYWASKKSTTSAPIDAKAVCEKVKAKTIGKDLPNDTKLSDAKFKAITELSFMADHDKKTCENWEKIKDACDSITA